MAKRVKPKKVIAPSMGGDLLDPTAPPQPGDASTRLYANPDAEGI